MHTIVLFNLFLSYLLTAPEHLNTRTPEDLTRYSYTEYHMGIDARLVVYAPNIRVAEDACTAAFKRIAELDSIMSDYRKDSELNRLCDKSGGPAVKVSADLYKVLRKAIEVSRQSEGAFDITVGPLIALWRNARKTGKLPEPAEIDQALKLVGWQHIHLESGSRVRLDLRGIKLDLGGIAKGYAGDSAQAILKKNGITRALVEMGGDIVLSGPPPDKTGWKIRVPNADKDLELANCAISTSGDTEQFVVIGGKHYSHVVDPRTGGALTSRVQATVIAPNGLTTDPVSKPLTILGEADRKKFLAQNPGVQAFVKVLHDEDSNKPWTSLFDGKTLAGWTRTEYRGGGKLTVENPFKGGPGALIVEAGERLSGANWTGGDPPKMDYEIELEFLKTSGYDFACGLTFPVAESHASLILGGWGGGVSGISSVDFSDASENETTRYIDYARDKWYKVRLRVTKDKIEAWLDDKQLVNLVTTNKRITLRPGDISLAAPLGISTYQTSAAYRNIRIRKLN